MYSVHTVYSSKRRVFLLHDDSAVFRMLEPWKKYKLSLDGGDSALFVL